MLKNPGPLPLINIPKVGSQVYIQQENQDIFLKTDQPKENDLMINTEE